MHLRFFGKMKNLMLIFSNLYKLTVQISGEVAQWQPPQISSANREVGGSNLTVSTDDPLE